MPYDVVWETNNLIAGTLSHLGKALGLGLVLEGIRWKVDA